MAHQPAIDRKILEIVRQDGRYAPGAYQFVFEALDFTMVRLGRHRRRGVERHLAVGELLDGMRSYAIAQYGPLARVVLESMGVFETGDIGEIVFSLVESGLLNKNEADRKEQFRDGFSFREAFDDGALAELSW